ncbi:DNA polymerase III subunit delta [Spiroplasma floricola]|uniref:DNA polymerase III subunit delta n=1 Tax=Spiroplasma floricola 23-6 TaxID=1336749 RepID=A0A2K8SDX2_9MOLU|nr:DNA polymerase III subunit delta [Spiroplasma floricola]AUB31664.1 DNA polymerase III subunit delta [Spiroplasma floricola 23-6]
MFFIYSNDNFLIKRQIEKLTQKINVDKEYEIFEYSLIDDPISSILEEINTYSIFSTKKIIIINECWFVTENKIKMNKTYDLKFIEQILNSTNKEVQIIMTLNSDKFSKRLKITKLVEEKCKLLKLDEPNSEQKKDILVKKLENNKIEYENEALELFIEKLPNDMHVFTNELAKIISLNKKLTCQLVEEITMKYHNFDTFQIANCFLSNDVKMFLKQWSSYLEINSDIFSFLALLANNLITLRNILILKQKNMNNSEIASTLAINPYRISKLLEQNKLNIDKINDKIKVLYVLEKNIKNGIYDSKIIPEIELLKMFNF